MNNNDILRRLRYAFNLSDEHACKLFRYAPYHQVKVDKTQWLSWIAKPNETEFSRCPSSALCAFLDGFIVLKRGLPKQAPSVGSKELNRNTILRKLKIAMNFRDETMLNVFQLGGSQLSKSELSALFRNEQHHHYRQCGGQLLRQFINGLTQHLRANKEPSNTKRNPN